jgi:hypothetical protein
LFFAAWQLQPTLANHSVVAFGEALDAVVNHGQSCCIVHVIVCFGDVAVTDIVPDAVIEQNSVLSRTERPKLNDVSA